MVTAAGLLEKPITYDIIVSDFGRDATIEYLRLVSNSEKRLIKTILDRDGLEFFDEYRRIMFTAIGDVAFFKEAAILKSALSHGHLRDDILIGVGSSPSMSQEFIDRVTLSVIQEALVAIDHGHNILRVMIPCNTLSSLAKQIGKMIHSDMELKRIVETYAPSGFDIHRLTTAHIDVYTVPEAVMRHLAETKKNGKMTHLLVLGTSGTNAIYGAYTESYAIIVLPIENWEQELIDEAIVASIGGDRNKIDIHKEQLQKEIIKPRSDMFENLTILEACTDFRLGLGVSSLEVFADVMVMDCYRTLIS
jgi:hypothetical protein